MTSEQKIREIYPLIPIVTKTDKIRGIERYTFVLICGKTISVFKKSIFQIQRIMEHYGGRKFNSTTELLRYKEIFKEHILLLQKNKK
jgi:hypothetical protein